MERATSLLILSALVAGMAAAAQDGTEFVYEKPRPPDARGKPQPPLKTDCWLPKDCTYVRGILVEECGQLMSAPRIRQLVAEEGLGMMRLRDEWKIAAIDRVFEAWAEASGRPEIKGAAILVAGENPCWRAVGYAAPDRVLGMLHFNSGNMHHGMDEERKTLAGVPFMAFNGQLDQYAPEGGHRPHLGLETQWWLMGEQMLERRRQDPNNLMSHVVAPLKSHNTWSHELAALYIRKAVRYRLPKEKRDGSAPAKCVPIAVGSGWLSDRNVKHPRHAPAAYAEYRGDRKEAFWHFDEEMALAVYKYHADGIRPGQERTLFRPAGLFERLWPLGEWMSIPFKGHSTNEYAAAVRQWVTEKVPNALHPIVLATLADSIASGLRKDEAGNSVDERTCRNMCLRVCYAYDDAFRPVEETIDKTALPAESKNLLRAHYAEQLLLRWPNGQTIPELPIRGIQARIQGIPGDSGPAAIQAWLKHKTPPAQDVMNALYGAVSGARPENLDGLIESLHKKPSRAWFADGSLVGPAVDELAKLGTAAIPDLVRLLEYGDEPADFRAAIALGRMGCLAAPALPELQRAVRRGGIFSELDAMQSPRALVAIEQINMSTNPACLKSGR